MNIDQPSQIGFDGVRVYRWFVWVGHTRFVTWAPTPELAREKTERRASMRRLALRVDRVEPAPPLANGGAR